MTNYEYCERMSELCTQISSELIKRTRYSDAKNYMNYSNGFYEKLGLMSVQEASQKANSFKVKRITELENRLTELKEKGK